MGGGIYLIQDDERLVEMGQQAYESDEQLQELIEQYPHLLAGDRIDVTIPRRWLAILRGGAFDSEEEGGGRWSLDRLFLDQNAIPTLVEVRPINNSRIRQEVIGQMLDYAANCSVYWPVDTIVAQFESNCRELGRDPEQVFEEFLGDDSNEERFWQKVKTHIQAGKIRLVFVSDNIPVELLRAVEFLNEQMDPAEVLAVEVQQYASKDDDVRVLVPRLIGQTAEAKQKKSSITRERRRWDETSFFQELESRRGKDEAAAARKIYEWVENKTPELEVEWGTGDTYGGFTAHLRHRNGKVSHDLFRVGIWGGVEIASSSYASQPPFDLKDKWQELRSQLSSIGMALPTDPGEIRFPYLRLSTLQTELAVDRVIQTFEWVVGEIKGTGEGDR
mgnify:CR=1 FL=1